MVVQKIGDLPMYLIFLFTSLQQWPTYTHTVTSIFSESRPSNNFSIEDKATTGPYNQLPNSAVSESQTPQTDMVKKPVVFVIGMQWRMPLIFMTSRIIF